ncbi:MAG: ABC transporter ATP-binding protein [Candidatus Micrarchaeia archaeon]
MEHIIVRKVTKRFGSTIALHGVSITPRKGLNFVLGPNGAGKSTLLKIIAGLYRPDGGTVSVMGEDPYSSSALKQHMSILTDNYALYDFLTLRKNIEFFGSFYGMKNDEAVFAVKEMLKELDIYDLLDSKVETFSRGTKQKAAFCRAIINDPKILLLDEPTAFIDANASNAIRSYIKENTSKKDIIFVTQKLDEVARLEGYVHIMSKGKIIKSTGIAGMYKDVLKDMIVNIRFAKPVYLGILKGIDGLQESYKGIATMVHVKIKDYKDISEAIDFIRGKGIDIVGIDYIEPFIESTFR